MEIKRETELIIKTNRRVVIRQSETAKQLLCPQCDEPMLMAEQIAILLGMSRRGVYQRIESGTWHFIEDTDGILFVCSRSLEKNLLKEEEHL